MRASRKRMTIWIVVTAIVGLLLLFSFRSVAIPVDLAYVERSDLIVSIDEEGKTRIQDVFVLSAPVAGNARRILLEVGDTVAMNDSIVTEIEPSDTEFLDPRSEAQARAALKAAESSLLLAEAKVDEAQAELDFATDERARARRLIVTNAIARQALDDAERVYRTRAAALNSARAAQQVRKFELERARAALITPTTVDALGADCVCIPVSAPIDGTILRVLHESEGIVAAGTPLAEIGNPRSIEIVVDLLSKDAVRVRPGQQVIIEDWGGPVELHGIVRRVEPFGFTRVSSLGIEEQRVNVIVDFANTDEIDANLGHGYRVLTRIVMSHDRNALTVPLTSLFRHGEEWAVFEVRDGRAYITPVILGNRNSLDAIVVEGLIEGAAVVTYPSEKITNAARVVSRDG